VFIQIFLGLAQPIYDESDVSVDGACQALRCYMEPGRSSKKHKVICLDVDELEGDKANN